jgi:hypothetical protein
MSGITKANQGNLSLILRFSNITFLFPEGEKQKSETVAKTTKLIDRNKQTAYSNRHHD